MTAADRAKSAMKSGAKRLLERAGFRLVRSTAPSGGVDDCIPFEPTMRAARAAGLSVGDYIDEVMNGTPGAPVHRRRVAGPRCLSRGARHSAGDRPRIRTVPGEDAEGSATCALPGPSSGRP